MAGLNDSMSSVNPIQTIRDEFNARLEIPSSPRATRRAGRDRRGTAELAAYPDIVELAAEFPPPDPRRGNP